MDGSIFCTMVLVYIFKFFPNKCFKIVYHFNSLASPHPGYDFDKLKSYLIRPPGRGVLKRLDSANPYFIFPYAHLGTFYIILK